MRLLSALPVLSCCTLTVLAGCKAKEGASTGAATDTGAAPSMAADTSSMHAMANSTATSAAATATATPMTLAGLAGRWEMRSKPDSGKDTSVVDYVLVAKADSTGWSLVRPNQKPIPVKVVAVGGDSLVTEAGPFQSFRRKGVQVRTRTVFRRQGDSLLGTTVAHYMTKGTDTVMTLRAAGARVEGAAAKTDTSKPKTDTSKAKM
jgi:hypothetical protein